VTLQPHPSDPLPADVTAALQRGNKIEAIKRLREARPIQLKEAKDLVDDYIRGDPALTRKYREQAQTAGRMLWLVVLGAVLALAYWMLSR
jgi:hypothetical protein